MTIKVLIVDDSQFIRSALGDELDRQPDLEVVARAEGPFQARDYIVRLQPDVMTLDLEMPQMDGLTFVKRLMPQWPLPTIMVSAHGDRNSRTTLEALDAGALDFVAKPSALKGGGFSAMVAELSGKIRMAARVDLSAWKKTPSAANCNPATSASPTTKSYSVKPPNETKLVVIGASTGGPQALHEIVKSLDKKTPPLALVQHMPAGFTTMFADRLNEISQIQVREARDGDVIGHGEMIVAPGGKELLLRKKEPGRYLAAVRDGKPTNGHLPSCDPLFRSCMPFAKETLGIILTGMGSDGADALKDLRDAGSFTIGQDCATSIVYGMPAVAMKRNAISQQLPLKKIGPYINSITATSLQQHA